MNKDLKRRLREREALACLLHAYRTALRMPHGALRARNQIVLATLRDAIAAEMGTDSQTVQDNFEAMEAQRMVA